MTVWILCQNEVLFLFGGSNFKVLNKSLKYAILKLKDNLLIIFISNVHLYSYAKLYNILLGKIVRETKRKKERALINDKC